MAQFTIRDFTAKIKEKMVLKDLEFVIHKGEFIAIVGPSGSGKSLLLDCLALKTTNFEGVYRYNGVPIVNPSWWARVKLAKSWAYMKENEGLQLTRTAFQNVLTGRKPHLGLIRRILNMPSVRDHVLVMDYLEKVGLLPLSKRNVEHLSGGEKRRVGIAKATIQEADVLFIDEPITGLDRQSAEMILSDLKILNETKQTTILCVISQMEFAEKYASRIIGLNHHGIVLDVQGRRLTSHEKNLLSAF
jgi:phosphonate transport system ATP-binding protein